MICNAFNNRILSVYNNTSTECSIKYLINFIEKYKKTDVIFKLIILSNDNGLNILSNQKNMFFLPVYHTYSNGI